MPALGCNSSNMKVKTMGDTLAEIEKVIADAEAYAPAASEVASLIPGAAPWMKATMLILTAVNNAVMAIQQARGGTTAAATTAVLKTLTPGQPSAPELAESAPAQPALGDA